MISVSVAKILRQPQVQRTSLRVARATCAANNNNFGERLSKTQQVSYHSSTPTHLPVRRRRRRDKSHGPTSTETETSNDHNPLKHPAVVDGDSFIEAANTLLSKIEKALLPMKEKNEIFIITRQRKELGDSLSIDLGPKDGTYMVEIDEEGHMIQYSSPISGRVIYVLSGTTSEWVGIEDGHSFEGLLVRDLIRQCQGLPDL